MASEKYPPFVDSLLNVIEDKEKFDLVLSGISPYDLVIAQDCLWNHAMVLSREKGSELKRETITSKIEDTVRYQRRVGCDEPSDYCRANICVNTNPNCAGDKLKGVIWILQEVISELKNQ